MNWRMRAACIDEDPDLFFAVGASRRAGVEIEQAKSVCRRCPVRADCLSFAIETGQESGVWGGLSEHERRVHGRMAARRGA